ncbi:hypothetical protein V499_03662 [Pseudogymnoascus sp. VKM F-103]|nr:hypothetical protein V499_03662 [Pseudogymnoascus sp. VKM F-103]
MGISPGHDVESRLVSFDTPRRPKPPTITVTPGASQDDRDSSSTTRLATAYDAPQRVVAADNASQPLLGPGTGRGRSSSSSSFASSLRPDAPPRRIFPNIPIDASASGSLEPYPRSPSFHDGSSTTTMAPVFSVGRSRASSGITVIRHGDNDNILAPGPGKRVSSHTEDNPFAFGPNVIAEMIASKSLTEFQALGGLAKLAQGLRTDLLTGLSLDEAWLHGTVRSGSASLATAARHQESYQVLQARRAVYGTNRLPDQKTKGIFELMILALSDKVLVLLSVVAIISLSLGLYQAFGQPHKPGQPRVEWVEGVTIMVAVIIVVVTGALNDYQKERQFARLNKRKEDRMVKAIRSGRSVEISIYDVLAGDVLHLEPGDLVPADGILISGYTVRCDESSMTGESEQIQKVAGDEALARLHTSGDVDSLDPFIIAGSKVLEGIGTYIVTGVGINSTHGRLMMSLTERTDETPLQKKLSIVADKIAISGVAAAVTLFVVLTAKFLSQLSGSHDSPFEQVQAFLRIFIVSIAIVVVAVPEGLPLAVTLALAIAVTRMLKDNNLVRILSACETMGNATTVCCDKTGTLTTNRMTVCAGTVGVAGRFLDEGSQPGGSESRRGSVRPNSYNTMEGTAGSSAWKDGAVPMGTFCSLLASDVRDIMVKSIAINSTAFEGEEDGKPAYIGSKTEAALLTFARDWLGMQPLDVERENAEVVEIYPFNSTRKCMAVVTQLPNGLYRIYLKGAPEIVLEKSSRVISKTTSQLSENVNLTEDRLEVLTGAINEYASQSLRTLGFAYRDLPSWPPLGDGVGEVPFDDIFADMTFIGVLGLQDPLRPGVEAAVELCQHAGVFVRMVTGDSVRTAQAVARKCGILTESGVIMEGPDFRKLSVPEMDSILPHLQVLARSSPEDKRMLVKRLKELGETVAVTGDGSNDGPALRAADVGFSMGISGTEVAKDASSIILMDDNFSSIVKAIEWGRTVNDVIKKFLHFQLTVNVTAVTLTFVSAVASNKEESILTPVQLLWVNLIMDTFAALALATEPANPTVLEREPERKTAPLISPTGWKMIIGQAIYQLIAVMLLYFKGNEMLGYTQPEDMERLQTLIFNAFVWMQVFNLTNNRRLDNKLNVFSGILQNPFFIAVNMVIITGQVLIIYFGGSVLATTRLSANEWAISLLIGFASLPVGMLLRLTPDASLQRIFTFRVGTQRSRETRASEASEGDQWHRAIENVRFKLGSRRQPRSSRLERLRRGILPFVKAKLFGVAQDDDGEVDEISPLLPFNSRQDLSRTGSICAPAAAVMAGIVAGGVAGWPRIPDET